MRTLLLSLGLIIGLPIFSHAQTTNDIYPCGNDDYYSPWLQHYLAHPIAGPRDGEVLYLPLQIHSVGADDGSGRMDERQLLAAFCTLNEDFAPTDIQFYLAGPINFIDNSSYYEHDYADGFEMMNTHSVPGVINCYIVERAAGACGYFAPGPDAIALNKNCNSPQDHTWAHEVGHYLSLPHTFFGWEGEDHDYAQPAPNDWDGWEVERMSGDNCTFAGDGFCDTPPDYLNYRWGCTGDGFSGVTQFDPDSVAFQSDGTLFMSYSSDGCMNRFSAEQTAAMRAMVLDYREYLLDPVPTIEDWVIDEENMVLTPEYPTPGEPVDASAGLTISWEPIAGATYYLVQVNPVPNFIIIFDTYLTNEPSLTLTDLLPGRNYYYRVMPYSPLMTCQGFTNSTSFTTAVVTGATTLDLDASLQLFPNPVHGGIVNVFIAQREAATANLVLTDALGRPVLQQNYSDISDQRDLQLDVSRLPNGVYTLRWQAGQQFISRKLVVQH